MLTWIYCFEDCKMFISQSKKLPSSYSYRLFAIHASYYPKTWIIQFLISCSYFTIFVYTSNESSSPTVNSTKVRTIWTLVSILPALKLNIDFPSASPRREDDPAPGGAPPPSIARRSALFIFAYFLETKLIVSKEAIRNSLSRSIHHALFRNYIRLFF